MFKGSSVSAQKSSTFRVWVVRLLLLLLGLVSVVVLLGWRLSLKGTSEHCQEFETVALSTDQLISMKRRFEAYRARHAKGAHLELGADEVSLLFQHAFEIEAEFQFEQGKVRARAALPSEEGCYNLTYSGDFSVKDGVAYVRPAALTLGELDLGPYVKEREIAFGPERMPKEKLSYHLRNLQMLEIKGDRVQLRMWDPNVTW